MKVGTDILQFYLYAIIMRLGSPLISKLGSELEAVIASEGDYSPVSTSDREVGAIGGTSYLRTPLYCRGNIAKTVGNGVGLL